MMSMVIWEKGVVRAAFSALCEGKMIAQDCRFLLTLKASARALAPRSSKVLYVRSK